MSGLVVAPVRRGSVVWVCGRGSSRVGLVLSLVGAWSVRVRVAGVGVLVVRRSRLRPVASRAFARAVRPAVLGGGGRGLV